MAKEKYLLALGCTVGVAALLTACTSGESTTPTSSAGAECAPATLAGLDDDSHRAAFYALENGLVESDVVPSVEVSYLQIPALIQATSSGQFDYVMTSLPGVVNAREAGGVDLRAVAYSLAHTGAGLAIYVKADSGIESPEDLAGKRVSIASFGSTATQEAQIVLEDKYGLNAALEGGDFTWVELDPPTQLNALEQGDIDASILWHQAGWIASNDEGLDNIAQLDVDFSELANGAWPIGSAFVASGEFVDANPECVAAFQTLLADSVAYAEENHEEFADEIADETGISADFINFWWQPENYQFGGVADETWLGYAREFYSLAYDHGFIPVNPDLAEITVIPAP